MAGFYLFPGSSKTHELSVTTSPAMSMDNFVQVYARQDDPTTQIDEDYYISLERFVMGPQTRRVAFSEKPWDAQKINADIIVSFIPGFLVHTNAYPLGNSVRIYTCVKTIRIKKRLAGFNVKAFLRNIEKPFTNSVCSTKEPLEVVDRSQKFANVPWIKDSMLLEDDVCSLLLQTLCEYGLLYEKEDGKIYISHFPWTTFSIACVHPTRLTNVPYLHVHALSDLWMCPTKGKCVNCESFNVEVKASYTYPYIKSEPLLCVTCKRLNKKYESDMNKALKYSD